MKRVDDFSQERICSLKNWWNWVRVNLSLRVFVRRGTDERFLTDASRAMTQRSPAQLSWREVYRHRNPGRRRARHFVCRCRYRTEVFDDFRRQVSVICCVAHFTQGPSSLTTSVFRKTLIFRRMTHIILYSSWKRILSSVEETSMFFFPSYFFEFARKETRLDDASGRLHFFV